MSHTGCAARILVIDDEPGITFTLGLLLKERFHVVTANSVEEGLRQLSSEEIALVIMDLRMPGTNGVDHVQRIHQRAPSIPVLVLTACVEPEIREAVYAHGISGLIEKPFSVQELLSIIDETLQHSQTPQQNPASCDRENPAS
jgi:DNA-binding NtrC family response regulator